MAVAVLYVIGSVLTIACLGAASLAVILLVEVMASIGARVEDDEPPMSQCRMCVLMPAHNEQAVIRLTLEAVMSGLAPGDRVLVVADNCDDDTAEIAGQMGADVIRRHDPTRRGKGYALDFGIRHLCPSPPDVVIVLDADCLPETGALRRLARRCHAAARPMQADYVMQAPELDAPPSLKIASFAWRVKNHVRPLGLKRLGFPSQLMGTGMAFPWNVIGAASLATGHLVEDLVLGLELAAAGTPARFAPGERVQSVFPTSREGQFAQRTRWEVGHLAVIRRTLPPLALQAFKARDWCFLALLVDVAVPPLALLAVVLVSLLLAASVVAFGGGLRLPLILATLGCVAFAAAIAGAWTRVGKDVIGFEDLVSIPSYIVWKFAIYTLALAEKPLAWARSKRD